MEPTVFADVGDDMAISKEEIFGPVQVIMKFDNLKDVRPGPQPEIVVSQTWLS